MSVYEPLLATWKFCRSFMKRNWELADYPVVIREQTSKPEYGHTSSHSPHQRYWASIVNWWVMTGGGDIPADAIAELTAHFSRTRDHRQREGKVMPRPGTRVPIEFASSERILAHPELTDDFIHRVLGLEWAFLTDESTLWHFHVNDSNAELHRKIQEVYGVDVSDVESGNVAEVLE